jgi:hypothetical protein
MCYKHKEKKAETRTVNKNGDFFLDFSGPRIFVFVGNFRMRQSEVMEVVCAKFRKAKSDCYCSCAVTSVRKANIYERQCIRCTLHCLAYSLHAGKDGLIVSGLSTRALAHCILTTDYGSCQLCGNPEVDFLFFRPAAVLVLFLQRGFRDLTPCG